MCEVRDRFLAIDRGAASRVGPARTIACLVQRPPAGRDRFVLALTMPLLLIKHSTAQQEKKVQVGGAIEALQHRSLARKKLVTPLSKVAAERFCLPGARSRS